MRTELVEKVKVVTIWKKTRLRLANGIRVCL